MNLKLNLPHAVKARHTAQQSVNAETNVQVQDIEKKISDAINAGRMETTVAYYLHPNVKKALMEQGYVINQLQSCRNETDTQIKW